MKLLTGIVFLLGLVIGLVLAPGGSSDFPRKWPGGFGPETECHYQQVVGGGRRDAGWETWTFCK